MTNVYRIVADADEFAFLDTQDRDAFLAECPFDGAGRPLTDPFGRTYQIKPPDFFVAEPDRPRPDIWSVCGLTHALAIPRRLMQLPPMTRFVEDVGQDFAIEVDGESFLVWVVTNVVNALDKSKSRLDPDDPSRVLEYAFHDDRIQRSPFREMTTRKHELLHADLPGSPCDQFKPVVEHLGWTGLRFEPLWSGGSPLRENWDEDWALFDEEWGDWEAGFEQ